MSGLDPSDPIHLRPRAQNLKCAISNSSAEFSGVAVRVSHQIVFQDIPLYFKVFSGPPPGLT